MVTEFKIVPPVQDKQTGSLEIRGIVADPNALTGHDILIRRRDTGETVLSIEGIQNLGSDVGELHLHPVSSVP